MLAAVAGGLIGSLALRRAPAAPLERVDQHGRQVADDGMRLTVTDEGDRLKVEVVAPHAPNGVRPPLALALALDHSSSMTGEPLASAKEAVVRLIEQLQPGDAFAIVAYADEAQMLAPMQLATAVHKDAAVAAVRALEVGHGTCISCGLDLAGDWLRRTPFEHGLRRVVLLTDGRPNLGQTDPDALIGLARSYGARNISVSTIGFGDPSGGGYDPVTLAKMAEVGGGLWSAATGRLEAVFDRELAQLAATVAQGAHLTIDLADGATFVNETGRRAVGFDEGTLDGPIVRGDQAWIPLGDLRGGETYTITLRRSGARGTKAELTWTRPLDGKFRHAVTTAR